MARVTMKPQARRAALLDAAGAVCREVGWGQVSVEAVTERAGVSKGLFYNYFDSKDDLRLAMAERFSDALFTYLEQAAGQTSGTALERLKAILDASMDYKTAHLQSGVDLVALLYEPGNEPLRHQFFHSWEQTTRRFLRPVVELALSDRTFLVDDVECTCDFILGLWFDYADRLWRRARLAPPEELADVMLTGSKAMMKAQARLLGLPEDTFPIAIEPPVAEAIESLNESLQGEK
ncbi:MAG: TetR/AcrR family transcriptional regulator [Propionibacteriaceae bacterium]|jgi:AcrR family transcriptional regulator|nr:TetR/AcrR family transcriptional regulator [Propionibacteriaceae bacterium]